MVFIGGKFDIYSVLRSIELLKDLGRQRKTKSEREP
jgi:hypothetical protein